jgi:hypothetical protein
LAAVQAAVTRRANRRIIMRQVGDRLIPVGITSGRVHALSSEEAGGESSENNGGSRRSRRRQQHQPGPFEQYLGQDLEEVCSYLFNYCFVVLNGLVAHVDGSDAAIPHRARRTTAQGS